MTPRRPLAAVAVLLALTLGEPAGSAAEKAAPTALPLPSPEGLLLLIRTTMVAIDQANKTADYAVLRQLGGPGLKAYSTTQLAQTFAALRANKIDLAPSAIVTPELTEKPLISPDGLLILEGSFPTKPLQMQFRFVYQADSGSWKPFGLSVSMVPSSHDR